jgi:hypothetical protein
MSETQEPLCESQELTDLERGFQEVGQKVKEVFAPMGLTVTGLNYYQPRRFQLEKKGIFRPKSRRIEFFLRQILENYYKFHLQV